MEKVLDNLAFFSSDILSVYIGRPDKYIVEFGLYGGHIKSLRGTPQENVIDLLFAFRELPDGELAIAAFKPDLDDNTAESERSKWGCFELFPSDFRDHPDPNFEEWASVYLSGNWAKETPPLRQVIRGIEWTNAISQAVAGCSLFSFHHAELQTIPHPFVNNTYAYQDSHRDLYRYMLEGIDKTCLRNLNDIRGVSVSNYDEMRGYKALRHSFPELSNSLIPTLEKISEQRAISVHGNRPKATKFKAYINFLFDLQSLADNLEHLVSVLENEYSISRQRALAISHLPNHSGVSAANIEMEKLSEYFDQEIVGFSICVIKKKGKVTRDALCLKFKKNMQIAITFFTNLATFIKKETPRSTDLRVDFEVLESEELAQAGIEYDEELMERFILQEAIQKLSRRRLVGFRLCDVEDESEYLPQRQLLFLDLDDGSSLAIEPAWNLGHKVNNGVIDLSSRTMAAEDIHLQMVLHDVPA